MDRQVGCSLDCACLVWHSSWLGNPLHFRKSVPFAITRALINNKLQLSIVVYLVDVYQSATSASAIAANGILRYTFGAVFPLFTLQMYETLGINGAGSVFAFASVLLMPLPWLFFKYGKVLRGRSRYETLKT